MDSAFEKARAAYGTGAYDDATLEFLFPQLKDSEDERIKKIITDSVFYQYGAGVEYKDVLDYLDNLEKQKEQKPIDVDYISGIREELLGIENNARNIDGLTESQWVAIRAAHRLLGEYIEKEQKPAWSEEDVDMLNSCISSIEEAKENRYAYKETDGDTSYDYEIAWLKSLRPQWRPSEEQMEALLWCTAHLGGADHRVLAELYEHLKMYCL